MKDVLVLVISLRHRVLALIFSRPVEDSS